MQMARNINRMWPVWGQKWKQVHLRAGQYFHSPNSEIEPPRTHDVKITYPGGVGRRMLNHDVRQSSYSRTAPRHWLKQSISHKAAHIMKSRDHSENWFYGVDKKLTP